jgi:hypothetical protein
MSAATETTRGFGAASLLGRSAGVEDAAATTSPAAAGPTVPVSASLVRLLAEVKGQAQFLLYLADQLEDSIQQLASETEPGQGVFLGKVLTMYSGQLEAKHRALGERIAEASQEIYVTARALDAV